MTKQFGERQKAAPPTFTDLVVHGWAVYQRAESNPVRDNHCHSSTSVWNPTALAQLEAR